MKTKNMTQIAVMTSLLCILSPLTIPLPFSPVPISLANFVIYIFAIILGTKKSLIGVGIYILIGLVGIPVFSKYSSGLGYIVGPTGGYLIGFFACAFFTGIASDKFKNKFFLILGMTVGTLICYVIGTLWLSYLNSMNFTSALFAGVIPFIPGDIIKIIISLFLGLEVKKRIHTM